MRIRLEEKVINPESSTKVGSQIDSLARKYKEDLLVSLTVKSDAMTTKADAEGTTETTVVRVTTLDDNEVIATYVTDNTAKATKDVLTAVHRNKNMYLNQSAKRSLKDPKGFRKFSSQVQKVNKSDIQESEYDMYGSTRELVNPDIINDNIFELEKSIDRVLRRHRNVSMFMDMTSFLPDKGIAVTVRSNRKIVKDIFFTSKGSFKDKAHKYLSDRSKEDDFDYKGQDW